MRLSKHFKTREFACKDGCGEHEVLPELIDVLEDVRNHFDRPVIITSGRRCVVHNKRAGGAPKSQHLLGTAADIRVQGIDPSQVYKYLDEKYRGKFGVGKYASFTHIDVRSKQARW